NDGGRGGAVWGEAVNEGFQMLHRPNVNFHDERVSAGSTVALHHLRRILDHGSDAREHISHHRNPDEGGNRHSHLHWIDVSVITDNNAGLFHPLDALHYRRGGKTHPAAQFGVRKPPVYLQLVEQLPADLIQKLIVS